MRGEWAKFVPLLQQYRKTVLVLVPVAAVAAVVLPPAHGVGDGNLIECAAIRKVQMRENPNSFSVQIPLMGLMRSCKPVSSFNFLAH